MYKPVRCERYKDSYLWGKVWEMRVDNSTFSSLKRGVWNVSPHFIDPDSQQCVLCNEFSISLSDKCPAVFEDHTDDTCVNHKVITNPEYQAARMVHQYTIRKNNIEDNWYLIIIKDNSLRDEDEDS